MRTSKLGQLYDKHQEIRPELNQVVQEYISEFEAFISFKEKLPIYSTPLYTEYTEEELKYMIDKFLALGCTVEYTIEKSPNGKRRFILTELS